MNKTEELKEQIDFILMTMCFSLTSSKTCTGRHCGYGLSVKTGLCSGLVSYRKRIIKACHDAELVFVVQDDDVLYHTEKIEL